MSTRNSIVSRSRFATSCPTCHSTPGVIDSLHWVLFDEEQYVGTATVAPIYSYLPQVLALKRGSAESLCLLYQAVAERLHLRVTTVRLPHRYCIRIRSGKELLHVDPFLGRRMTPSESLRASDDSQRIGYGVVSHEEWLQQLLSKLQFAMSRGEHHDDLNAILEFQELLNLV